MKKKTLSNLDVDIYEEKLSNGLEVYVVPTTNKNGIYVTFSTKYGSTTREFVPIDEDKMTIVPDGIAHFLEHKVFEQENGIDPFTFYSERGADCNANTSNEKTTYLFSGTNFFKENLELLLSYVTSPYFTDENVLKEKGIIEQEIKMYDDDPFSKLYDSILYNSFVKHPIRINVAGTVESINKITKDDLYKCYNTFYHPSNMFIVITGNVDVRYAIEIIKDFYKTKKYPVEKEIEIKKYKEPDKVFKDKIELDLNISIPKVALNYKVNITKSKISLYKKLLYLNILMDLKLGSTSEFLEKLRKEGIINNDIAYDFVNIDTHVLIIIIAETKKQEKFIENVKNQLLDLNITENDLLRKKKTIISSLVYMSDSIYGINHKIMNNIMKYNGIIYNNYEEINSLNLKEFNEFIKTIDLNNMNIILANPSK